jgi:molybdenum cofactor cytidylyltransferase
MTNLDKTSSVGLILLAAGVSSRLGTPKQLLSVQGQSLLRRSAMTALATQCRPALVVLGAYSERLREEIHDLPLTVVENPFWRDGMGTSIRAGVTALQDLCDVAAVALTLCDQPLITARSIDALVSAQRTSKSLAAASEYNGTIGVPAVFDLALFSELRSLDGASGAKQVLQRHRDQVVSLSVPEAGVDIDTAGDYDRFMATLRSFDSGFYGNPESGASAE